MASPQGSILVTGANGGLGSALAAAISTSPDLAGYHGIYTVRKVETATALKRVLDRAPPERKGDVIAMDLAKLASVRATAVEINRRVAAREVPPLRAVVLNAAYQEWYEQTFTEDGFDMSFQANYLGHFLLVLLILESIDKEHGRIVVVGSYTHDTADKRNELMGSYPTQEWKEIFHDTESLAKGTWSPSKDNSAMQWGFRRYGAGKLCEIMMIFELQKRLDADPALSGISILGVDPGGMATGIGRRSNWFMRTVVMQLLMPVLVPILVWFNPDGDLRTPSLSAQHVLRGCFNTEELGERPKRAYFDGRRPLEPGVEAKDPKKGEMLWRDSLGYAGVKKGDTVLVNWQ